MAIRILLLSILLFSGIANAPPAPTATDTPDRIIDVSYQQKLFDEHVELRLGRFAAMDDSRLAVRLRIHAERVLRKPIRDLIDAPGMSAYYGTWATLGKVKPTKRSYVMTGIYNGDPAIRENKYHGVIFTERTTLLD